MLMPEERFLEFMRKRENLRLQKEAGRPWPWSDDSILNEYKFTNVKRENDRTTKWMREHWTRINDNGPWGEIIFNCAVFRYFGTVEFAQSIGWIREWQPFEILEIAEARRRRGERVFTGAYIIPTLGLRGSKARAVIFGVLSPLWDARNSLAKVAELTQSWQAVALEMRGLPGFGGTGFMTKEVLQDVMQTPVLRNAKDKNTWCPAGPGARRGLNRIYGFELEKQRPEADLLREMLHLFGLARGHDQLGHINFELHDIQFQLCEFDKYERTRLGEGRPKSRYRFDRR